MISTAPVLLSAYALGRNVPHRHRLQDVAVVQSPQERDDLDRLAQAHFVTIKSRPSAPYED